MAVIDGVRIQRMARDVIADEGLPLELVSVVHEPPRWRIGVRDSAQRTIDIFIAEAETARELRLELRQKLDAACS